VALVAALVLALSGAGLAIAKKKHHGKPPRGPYPSLGGCPVFPQSSAAPNAPSAADESAWHQDVSAAPLDPNSASYIAYIDAQDGPAHAVAVALKQYGALIADNRANGSSPAPRIAAGPTRTSISSSRSPAQASWWSRAQRRSTPAD
jgi:hypothetical protein